MAFKEGTGALALVLGLFPSIITSSLAALLSLFSAPLVASRSQKKLNNMSAEEPTVKKRSPNRLIVDESTSDDNSVSLVFGLHARSTAPNDGRGVVEGVPGRRA